MDQLLARRYAALVENVEPDSTTASIRQLIHTRTAQNHIILRPDAEYFLIVNFVEMILRPYAEKIQPPSKPLGFVWQPSAMRKYKDFTIPVTLNRIGEALDIILERLPAATDPEGISAHQVLATIDRNWQELGNLFFWG
jgi:hypothetical protein